MAYQNFNINHLQQNPIDGSRIMKNIRKYLSYSPEMFKKYIFNDYVL